jgi:hypothetical protein
MIVLWENSSVLSEFGIATGRARRVQNSGSSRVESVLDATTSQNMMVSWRRSASEAAAVGRPICGTIDGAGLRFPTTTLFTQNSGYSREVQHAHS